MPAGAAWDASSKTLRITGNGVISFIVASLLFGLLHIYQKVWGVIGATLLGLGFSLLYLMTGSIWVVMVVHAVIDLRSLILIPIVVQGVWRKTGDGDSAA